VTARGGSAKQVRNRASQVPAARQDPNVASAGKDKLARTGSLPRRAATVGK
jgi:hypothetical protein